MGNKIPSSLTSKKLMLVQLSVSQLFLLSSHYFMQLTYHAFFLLYRIKKAPNF